MKENQHKASGPDQGAARAEQPRVSVNKPPAGAKLSSLGQRALEHAAQGWKVFPCKPLSKIPLIKWKEGASTDPEQIVRWWQKWPDANIAAPAPGLVLDVDRWKLDKTGEWADKKGRHTLIRLEAELGKLPRTRTHRTPGGGRQYLFSTDGRRLRQTQNSSLLGEGVDTRVGGSGLILLPGSVLATRGGGTATYDTVVDGGLARFPDRWAERLVPPKPAESGKPALTSSTTPYGQAALKGEVEKILAASKRREQFNRSRFRIAQLEASGEVNPEEAEAALGTAGEAVGIDAEKVEYTLRQAGEAGAKSPRQPLPRSGKTASTRGPWITLSSVGMRPVVYAKKPLFLKASFHLAVGEKGTGKSTYCVHVAAAVTRGEFGPKKKVLWIAAGEDSLSRDIHPRVKVAGGDPDLVVCPTFSFKLPDDVQGMVKMAEELGDVGLIVIDPVAGTFDQRRKSKDDIDVRTALSPLNEATDRLECLILGIRHPRKDKSGSALDMIAGSMDWRNVPRVVIMIAADDADPELRHAQVIAGNRLPPGQSGIAFKIVAVDIPELKAQGGEPITKAVVVGNSDKDVESLVTARQKSPSKTKQAKMMILDLLEQATEIESDTLDSQVAQATGLAVGTVKNAKTDLKDEGLIKFRAEKSEAGVVERWLVRRSLAPRPGELGGESDTS
jgi:Bifunctional DNA primase/polymerase, N-terminal/AAA domain